MSDLTLLEANRATLTKAQADECSLLASLGFGYRFKPQSFTLEPGYSISVDIKGATISRQGNDTRVNLSFAAPRGVKFLPVEHLDLTAGPARATHRHFIETFRWIPRDAFYTRWMLAWQLFEVVRSELVPIASEQFGEVSTANPPTNLTPEMRDLVRLNVTPAGDVEVAIGGDHPHGGVIDSEAERLQALKSSTAKRLAETIDYARPLNPYRVPSFELRRSHLLRELVRPGVVAGPCRGAIAARQWQATRTVRDRTDVRSGSVRARHLARHSRVCALDPRFAVLQPESRGRAR